MKNYDLIIIGSGGGAKLRPAADLGKKVAIIEKEDLGGTCLNRGCIPSKMLIYPSDLITSWLEDREKFFIESASEYKVDFKALVERTTQSITKDSESIAPFYEKHENVDLYRGHARFVDNKVVQVNGEQLTANRIYIATGTRPSIPPIEGLKDTPFMTSREALRNTVQPKKMIVIGGGYIATELGHFYGAMGTEVHFVVRSGLIGAEDKDVREAFTKDFSARYNVHLNTTPVKVEYSDETFTVTMKDGSVMTADSLFVAAGIRPNSDDLGLENTNIEQTDKGYIKVDDCLETTEPGVYGLGDVVGNYFFRHSVNFEGEYLFNQHYQNAEKAPINYAPVPHAIFSYPQVAGVGFTEDQLIKVGKVLDEDYVVAINDYKNSAMGDAMRPKVGFVKLIADKKTGKLIGAHIIGAKSSDIIHMLIAYITMEATIEDLLKMIYIHPALSEVIRNAARKLVKQL